MFQRGRAGHAQPFHQPVDTTGKLQAQVFNHGNRYQASTATYNDNQWHYLVATFDNGVETIYVDNVLITQATNLNQNAFGNGDYSYHLGVGYTNNVPNGNNSYLWLTGQMDEARAANTPRSAGWIATEFNNQHTPGTFISVLAENQPIVVVPGTAPVYGGQTQQFTATAGTCSANTVLWTVTPTGFGTIDNTGLFAAPPTVSTPQVITVRATSTLDGSVSGAATLSVYPPPVVTVTPATASIGMGQTQTFAATVANADDQGVTWSIFPALGFITANGRYTAPASLTGQTQVRITATSVVDATRSGFVTLLVGPLAAAPTITPGTGTYAGLQTVTLTTTTDGASIRYTLDGSTPTASTGTLYTVPFTVASTVTIKALAFGAGITDSAAATATLTFGTATATARFVYVDSETSGNWPGRYGRDGYHVATGTPANPPYGVVSFAGLGQPFGAVTGDTKVPQRTLTDPTRVLAWWNAGGSWTFEVNLTDGQPHQLGLYLLD